MLEILIGTHNRHKTAEISRLLSGLPIRVRDLTEFPHIPPVEENGNSLLENSRKKAKTYGEATGLLCLADDTGLEVEALGGEPGVYSARYAGEHCSFQDNCNKLLKALGANPNRKARFVTVITLYDPASGTLRHTEGAIEGEITEAMRGEGGFGYDPVFFSPEAGKTLAEMTTEQKNGISHRARAVRKMVDLIKKEVLKIYA